MVVYRVRYFPSQRRCADRSCSAWYRPAVAVIGVVGVQFVFRKNNKCCNFDNFDFYLNTWHFLNDMLTFDLMTCEQLNFWIPFEAYFRHQLSITRAEVKNVVPRWTWVRCWRHLPRWCVPWEDDREVSRIFPPPGGWTSIKSRVKVPQCCTYNSNRLRQSSRWKAIEQKVTATAQLHSHDPVSFATDTAVTQEGDTATGLQYLRWKSHSQLQSPWTARHPLCFFGSETTFWRFCNPWLTELDHFLGKRWKRNAIPW